LTLVPEDLLAALAGVRSVGVITGAGVSRESGIPTYRGRGGIYDDPVQGDDTVEALSGPTLRRDPDRTWRAVAHLARLALGAQPNAAHRAVAEMERRAERFVLLTQNVDELHRIAGSRNLIEIHGSARETLCLACGARGRLEREEVAALDRTPRCGACGGPLRPDVVLFGEMLGTDDVERLHRELVARSPDLLVVAGTSALFPYILEPVVLAARRRRVTVEVNPEETVLSQAVRHSIRAPAGAVLPLLAEGLPRLAADAAGSPA
jgi:NAD-dependent deacetylase